MVFGSVKYNEVLWILESVFASLYILSRCSLYFTYLVFSPYQIQKIYILLTLTLGYSVFSLLLEQRSFKALISNVEGKKMVTSIKEAGLFDAGWWRNLLKITFNCVRIFSILFLRQMGLLILTSLPVCRSLWVLVILI